LRRRQRQWHRQQQSKEWCQCSTSLVCRRLPRPSPGGAHLQRHLHLCTLPRAQMCVQGRQHLVAAGAGAHTDKQQRVPAGGQLASTWWAAGEHLVGSWQAPGGSWQAPGGQLASTWWAAGEHLVGSWRAPGGQLNMPTMRGLHCSTDASSRGARRMARGHPHRGSVLAQLGLLGMRQALRDAQQRLPELHQHRLVPRHRPLKPC